MSHVTTLHSQRAILQDRHVNGIKNSTMILDGPLLNVDAPPCAHFRITPHSFGPLDISSFVPKRAEPGEVCTRLMIPLEVLSDSTKFRSYLVSLGNESYRSQSGIRATVLFAREPWWKWAENNCAPLSLTDSDLLSRTPEDGSWSVATKFQVRNRGDTEKPDIRKLSCTIVVADGLECDQDIVEWERVFRVHAVRFWRGVCHLQFFGKLYCVLCVYSALNLRNADLYARLPQY